MLPQAPPGGQYMMGGAMPGAMPGPGTGVPPTQGTQQAVPNTQPEGGPAQGDKAKGRAKKVWKSWLARDTFSIFLLSDS